MRLALCAFVLCVRLRSRRRACGGDDDSSGGEGGQVDRFDSDAAWRLVEQQVEVGQRPAGLAAAAEARRGAAAAAARAGASSRCPGSRGFGTSSAPCRAGGPASWSAPTTTRSSSPRASSAPTTAPPARRSSIEAARAVAAAERKLADRRAARARSASSSSTARSPPPGLPEESADFYHSGLRGSRAYVAAHPDRTAAMVLLDYVGNKGLKLPREGSSHIELWSRLRGRRAQGRRAARLPAVLRRHDHRRPHALPPRRASRRST